jgi:transposase
MDTIVPGVTDYAPGRLVQLRVRKVLGMAYSMDRWRKSLARRIKIQNVICHPSVVSVKVNSLLLLAALKASA